MAEPNERDVELAHEVDLAYVKATEHAETIELAGERCREVLARAFAAHREELAGDRAFLEASLAALQRREVHRAIDFLLGGAKDHG